MRVVSALVQASASLHFVAAAVIVTFLASPVLANEALKWNETTVRAAIAGGQNSIQLDAHRCHGAGRRPRCAERNQAPLRCLLLRKSCPGRRLAGSSGSDRISRGADSGASIIR